MGPDTEVKERALPAFNSANLGFAALFGAVLGLGIALRVARFAVGDYYEDGASHWWTAASAVQTGVVFDPFNRATDGFWLPGYDQIAVTVMGLVGSTDMTVLRVVGLVFFAAAEAGLVFLAWPAGRSVALVAAGLLAVSPFDVLNAPIAIGMEPAIAFLCTGLALLQRGRGGPRGMRIGASVFFAVAVMFRYEAIPFIGVILLYNWWWGGGRPLDRAHGRADLPYLVFPLLVAAFFLAVTWGHNFPSRVLEGRPAELNSTEAFGYVPQDPIGRNAEFWKFWIGAAPVAIALAGVGIVYHARRVEAWLVVVFAALLAIFLFLNLGTPSVRYMQPVEPMVWFMAALGGRRLLRAAARAVGSFRSTGGGERLRTAAAGACVVLLLSTTMATGAAAMIPVDQRIALHGPLYRAADFLASLPQDDSKLVLVDSPLAAEASGLAPTRLIGSATLPADKAGALAFITERVQYVLAVNVSYYRLIQLFGPLGWGKSNQNFSLLYDATGWEIQYSSKTAFVYRVNHGDAALRAPLNYTLRFPLHVWSASGSIPGLQLFDHESNLTEGAPGIGVPTMVVDGREYAACNLDARLGDEAPTRTAQLNYTLYPWSSPGHLNTSEPRATVRAVYRYDGGALFASYAATPPPNATSFTLRINSSVPGAAFAQTFNDSLSAPTSAPFAEGPVWSLQSWLIGSRAIVQFDFTAPSLLYGGRNDNGSAWVAYEAPVGAANLSFPFNILAPGSALFRDGEPYTLKAPLYRAGGFMRAFSWNLIHEILTDFADGPFPYVAESSGLPDTAFASSASLPATRAEALDWLHAHIAVLVVANRSGDPLLALFPELATGDSTRDFSLIFDAGGAPGSLDHGLVWVYEVNDGTGHVRTNDADVALRFDFEQDAANGTVRGLMAEIAGAAVVLPTAGLGVPSAVANGTAYAAGSATLEFVPGTLGREVQGTFLLYPEENGTLNRSAPPIAVSAHYAYADHLLSVDLNASGADAALNITLTARFDVNATMFPRYANDTNLTVVTAQVPRTNIWTQRNFLQGDFGTLQADFTDPYWLYLTHQVGGASAFDYEAPPGGRVVSARMFLLPPALSPIL